MLTPMLLLTMSALGLAFTWIQETYKLDNILFTIDVDHGIKPRSKTFETIGVELDG